MSPITLKTLAPNQRGCQLTTLEPELNKGVVLTLDPRTQSATVCPFCGTSDKSRKWGLLPCKKCGEPFVPPFIQAKQHVGVSFSKLSDKNGVILDEMCPTAFISVPNPSYLYLFNHSKFTENIRVMWE